MRFTIVRVLLWLAVAATVPTIAPFDAPSTRTAERPDPGGRTTASGSAAAATTWREGSPSPILRAEAEGAAIGDKLFVFGGYSYPLNGFSPYSRVDVYDVTRNAWTRRRDLPRPVNHAGVAADGTDVYIAGGYVANATTSGAIFGTREVWKYDSVTDSYSAMPPLPVARAAGQLVMLGRALHYFGGANQARTVDTGDHWALNLDSTTTGWQRRAPLPNPRNHLGAVALNGQIYAVGGQHNHDAALTTQRDVHRYDPATDRWTAVAPLPPVVVSGVSYGRGHIAATTFVRDGRIVVAGGEYRHMHPVRDVLAYDPAADQWTALNPLPVARYSGVAHQFGATLVYATGGDERAQFTNTTWLGCAAPTVPSPTGSDACAVHGPTPGAVRINAGGAGQTVDGVTWSACRDVAGCNGWVSGGKRYTHSPAPAVSGVTAPANVALYQSEWTGDPAAKVPVGGVAATFAVPVANGTHTVRLHFAENYQSAVGARTFDVNLEGGTKELTTFDVFAQAGGTHKAVVRAFPVTVTDGVLTIELLRQVEQPFINAIEVLPTALPPAPTATRTPVSQPTASATMTPWPPSTAVPTVTPTSQPTATATATPISQPTSVPTTVPPGSSTVRINAGGYAQTVDGVTWSGCRDLAGCSGWVSDGRRHTHSPAPAVTGVVAPANGVLYQAEWTEDAAATIPVGDVAFRFDIPVADGAYTVRLHFAENSQSVVGARLFDVNLEGGPAELTALDVYAAAGGKSVALVRAVPVTINDGVLTMQFVKRIEQPFVNGIEIVPADG